MNTSITVSPAFAAERYRKASEAPLTKRNVAVAKMMRDYLNSKDFEKKAPFLLNDTTAGILAATAVPVTAGSFSVDRVSRTLASKRLAQVNPRKVETRERSAKGETARELLAPVLDQKKTTSGSGFIETVFGLIFGLRNEK